MFTWNENNNLNINELCEKTHVKVHQDLFDFYNQNIFDNLKNISIDKKYLSNSVAHDNYFQDSENTLKVSLYGSINKDNLMTLLENDFIRFRTLFGIILDGQRFELGKIYDSTRDRLIAILFNNKSGEVEWYDTNYSRSHFYYNPRGIIAKSIKEFIEMLNFDNKSSVVLPESFFKVPAFHDNNRPEVFSENIKCLSDLIRLNDGNFEYHGTHNVFYINSRTNALGYEFLNNQPTIKQTFYCKTFFDIKVHYEDPYMGAPIPEALVLGYDNDTKETIYHNIILSENIKFATCLNFYYTFWLRAIKIWIKEINGKNINDYSNEEKYNIYKKYFPIMKEDVMYYPWGKIVLDGSGENNYQIYIIYNSEYTAIEECSELNKENSIDDTVLGSLINKTSGSVLLLTQYGPQRINGGKQESYQGLKIARNIRNNYDFIFEFEIDYLKASVKRIYFSILSVDGIPLYKYSAEKQTEIYKNFIDTYKYGSSGIREYDWGSIKIVENATIECEWPDGKKYTVPVFDIPNSKNTFCIEYKQ